VSAPTRTHYQLLGLEPSADVETIKRAFRREIARYHPDKVTHLGPEFQEMASTRAAELTAAYKTLTDPHARAEYDAALTIEAPPPRPAAPSDAAPPDAPGPAPEPAGETEAAGRAGGHRFAQERAGRDDIMRRATVARVREVLQQVVGDCDMSPVRGFDLACVTRQRPSILRRTVPPSALVVLAPVIDGDVASEAWKNAVRAALPIKPVALLLIGSSIAPAAELGRVIDAGRRKNPAMQDVLFPVPVDLRDWSARIPANAPDSVRTLVERLKTFVG
jgi:hypothetical protein